MTAAPKGLNESLAILKNCFPNGIPTIVMHQRHPARKFINAIHQPFKRNQMTFTRNDTAPPPYLICFPKGQKDKLANLKH